MGRALLIVVTSEFSGWHHPLREDSGWGLRVAVGLCDQCLQLPDSLPPHPVLTSALTAPLLLPDLEWCVLCVCFMLFT